MKKPKKKKEMNVVKYLNPLTEGRRRALEHLQKYPQVDYEQQQRLAKELSWLTRLRPSNCRDIGRVKK